MVGPDCHWLPLSQVRFLAVASILFQISYGSHAFQFFFNMNLLISLSIIIFFSFRSIIFPTTINFFNCYFMKEGSMFELSSRFFFTVIPCIIVPTSNFPFYFFKISRIFLENFEKYFEKYRMLLKKNFLLYFGKIQELFQKISTGNFRLLPRKISTNIREKIGEF